MKIETNEINVTLNGNKTLLTIKVEDLEVIQNIICQEIVDINIESTTLITIVVHDIVIKGRGMFFNGDIAKNIKDELIEVMPYPFCTFFERVTDFEKVDFLIYKDEDNKSYIS
jgi:hypothetical protein